MSMNIKNEETHKLAQELAELTGDSITGAVTKALKESLERTRRTKKIGVADQLMQIAEDCASRIKPQKRKVNHGELLYDENGLPK